MKNSILEIHEINKKKKELKKKKKFCMHVMASKEEKNKAVKLLFSATKIRFNQLSYSPVVLLILGLKVLCLSAQK